MKLNFIAKLNARCISVVIFLLDNLIILYPFEGLIRCYHP